MIATALISGAGIAGPLAATLLARSGVEVTVVEIADSLRTGGQAVDLRGAAKQVFDRLGLLEPARAMALQQRGIADVDSAGKHRTETLVEHFGGDGIISELEVLRGDLARLLVDAGTQAGATYLFGTKVTEVRQDDSRVEVTLGDGSTRTVDLLIGADGPHSAVRRLVFGPEERFVRPLGGYTSWFSAPEGASLQNWYQMYNAPGGLVASLRPGQRPGEAKASLSFRSPPLDYDRRDRQQQWAILRERFRDAGWRVPELLAATEAADDFHFDALAQVRMPRWHSGRVVLIGDAAHSPSPLTGLGTTLAAVGSYLLAAGLAGTDDVEHALATSEQQLRPFVTAGQQLPPGGIRSYAPMTRAAIAARMLSTRLMVARPFRGLTRRMLFSKADAIELPTDVQFAGGGGQ